MICTKVFLKMKLFILKRFICEIKVTEMSPQITNIASEWKWNRNYSWHKKSIFVTSTDFVKQIIKSWTNTNFQTNFYRTREVYSHEHLIIAVVIFVSQPLIFLYLTTKVTSTNFYTVTSTNFYTWPLNLSHPLISSKHKIMSRSPYPLDLY